MKIYIAGPMRGYAQFNFPAFDEASARGRALGHRIVSPAEMDREADFDEKQTAEITPAMSRAFAKRDTAAILECDAIALLPGWERSTGAKAELALAKWIGIEVLDARTFRAFATMQTSHNGRLVGLCGYALCGKDSIYQAMGAPWQRAAFADALKADIDPLYPTDTPKHLKRPVYVEHGRAMRAIDPDYWVKRIVIPDGDCVVTDVRYVNEVDHIYRLGGIVIRVIRPGVQPANREELKTILDIDRRFFKLPLPRIYNDSHIKNAVAAVHECLTEIGHHKVA